MSDARRLLTEDRERAILRTLHGLAEPESGAPVSKIIEQVKAATGDTASVPAYYKLLDRLEASGKVERLPGLQGGDARRYRLAPYLHAENALTLDDVYEQMEALSAPESIALVVDARSYYEENRQRAIHAAAEALLEEDPRELFAKMIEDRCRVLRADLAILGEAELRDRSLEARVLAQLRDLDQLCYRHLGLSRHAIDVARIDEHVTRGRAVTLDGQRLRRELEGRVFGETFIRRVQASPAADPRRSRLTVAGSDGSTHPAVLQLSSAPTHADDAGHHVITFNNAVAYVEMSEVDRRSRGAPAHPFHSVPMTRSALEDRATRGMVMAHFMYRYLSESEYEHMAKCATDVVQWRVDEAVFLGPARALSDGALLPRPRVHIRDGTVTPQEREYGHYRRRNEYGDMVREGIAHGRKILDRIRAAGASPPVFAGAVKSTQIRLFSTLLNWYIASGSASRLGHPIDPGWDMTRAAHISDNEAMSMLLSTLEREAGAYFVSCAAARPFHALTEFYSTPDRPSFDWVAYFDRRRDEEIRRYRDEQENEPPWLAGVPDVGDDDFVFMMQHADYAMFYIGHSGGDPPPLAPRYEFLTSLRDGGRAVSAAKVEQAVHGIVTALDLTKLALDRDHNFLTGKRLVKIIPYVVQRAHETCKALGRQLQSELRSVVVARLKELRDARAVRERDVSFRPMTTRRFLERFAAAREQRPGPDDR